MNLESIFAKIKYDAITATMDIGELKDPYKKLDLQRVKETNNMKISESIIISIDISENGDTAVLAVCRKQLGNITEIVNIFQGEEAIDLYTKLITTKENSMSTKHRNDGDEVIVFSWPDTKGAVYKDFLVNEDV